MITNIETLRRFILLDMTNRIILMPWLIWGETPPGQGLGVQCTILSFSNSDPTHGQKIKPMSIMCSNALQQSWSLSVFSSRVFCNLSEDPSKLDDALSRQFSSLFQGYVSTSAIFCVIMLMIGDYDYRALRCQKSFCWTWLMVPSLNQYIPLSAPSQ